MEKVDFSPRLRDKVWAGGLGTRLTCLFNVNAIHIIQVGDKVYVTQELEGNMCLGVCNDCYGKFPESILRMLSEEEVCTALGLLIH